MYNKPRKSLKIIIAIISSIITTQVLADEWESLASKDKSLNRTIITSSVFTIDTKNNSVKIKNEWRQDCDNTYGTKYGAIALNSKQIKLKFTCDIRGRYGKDKFEIATGEGMKYAYSFLNNHKKFTYQITTPQTVRGKNKVNFQTTLKDVIDNPLNQKIIKEKTKGMWVGIKDNSDKYFLFEDIKNKRDNLLNITYDANKNNIILNIDLSKVYWTDGYPSSNTGLVVGRLSDCEYLKFKNKSGVLHINEQTIKFPLECKRSSSQTSIRGMGIDFMLVPSVGNLKSEEITVQTALVKNIEKLKTINISFEFQGIQKKSYNKSIIVKRTILDTIAALDAKSEKNKKDRNNLNKTVKNKVDNAI